MNRRNSIALLAGGVLVAVAATGCSSNPAKAAAAGPAAGSPSAPGAPGSPSTSASVSAPSAPGSVSSSSSAAGAPSTGATTTAAAAPPVQHPACDNAKLNASLAQGAGQSPANPIIAVKNSGPTCLISPIPYLWIVKSPTDASDQLRPLIPGGQADTAKLQTFLAGTTLYAAVDLNPNSVADAPGSYTYLEVTANPTRNTSGKDVQDVQLPIAAAVSGPKLGVYATNPTNALNALQYSTTPES